ncbi:hypothetical protein ACT453_14515, partial [Bacillus sp. D-CC]
MKKKLYNILAISLALQTFVAPTHSFAESIEKTSNMLWLKTGKKLFHAKYLTRKNTVIIKKDVQKPPRYSKNYKNIF